MRQVHDLKLYLKCSCSPYYSEYVVGLVSAPASSTYVMACSDHSLYSPRWHRLIDASPSFFPGNQDACKRYCEICKIHIQENIFRVMTSRQMLKQVNKLRGDLEYTTEDTRPSELAYDGLHGAQPKCGIKLNIVCH